MASIKIFRIIANSFPELGIKLKQANMQYTPEEFAKKTFMTALYLDFGIVMILFMFLANLLEKKILGLVLLASFPLLLVIMFIYFFRIPDLQISKLEKAINKEIIFAGRFMIVELESGVSLYDSLQNMGKSYKVIGAYFREIIDKVKMGTSLETAINDAVELVPSSSMRKILWQVSNSLKTGSDIAQPLKNVIRTLIKEQQIEVSEYGRKLNPLAMFYMLIAIIVPSLGITLMTIMAIFMGIKLSLTVLLVIVGVLGFIQFMFVAIVNSSRPAVEF